MLARMVLCTSLLAAALAGALGTAAPARGEDAPKALDQYFKGAVIGLKGKVVTLRYDFSTEEQLADWVEGVPWPIEKSEGQVVRWLDEKLEVKGSTGSRHKAEWTGDVWTRCTLVPDADKDIGAFTAPSDMSDNYVTYSLVERYFHAWDNHAGGGHGIMKFGKQWRESGSAEFIGFRYVIERMPMQPMKVGTPIEFGFGIEKSMLGMDVPELQPLRGRDPGVRMKEFHPGFYAVNGRLLVDNVVITGRLSDEWLAREGVALRTVQPIPEPGVAVEDPRVRALVEGYAQAKVPAADLIKVVGDAGAAKPSRDAAAAALSAGPKKAVRGVIDLLYRPDVESRTYGCDIVRKLLGKDYGYNPKGSEEKRSEAIKKINEDLKRNPGLLEGG
jgi:hypothetical protein